MFFKKLYLGPKYLKRKINELNFHKILNIVEKYINELINNF